MFQLQDNQQVTITFQGVDAKGQPVSVPAGGASWTTSDPSVCTITPSSDGGSCLVVAGNVGTATITLTISGVSGTLGVQVISGPPVNLNLIPGVPVPQPAPAGPPTGRK